MVQEAIEKRIIDYSWDFRKSNTKRDTHCYHPYPAMMIPQIAERLINEYKPRKTELLFDPYCGTGTSLVEAKLKGINSIGTDLNPMARLISEAKVINFDLEAINKAKNHIFHRLYNFNVKELSGITLPTFNNIDYWFSPRITQKLAYLRKIIFSEIDQSLIKFFLIPFSETVREGSYTRNGEFKLYRIRQDKIPSHNPDVFKLFMEKTLRNYSGLISFNKKSTGVVFANVYDFDTCVEMPEKVFGGKKIDMIVTSPPYGDSRTTVAYGQFSRLSNQWLNIEDAHKIDNQLMGGNGINGDKIILDSAQKELGKIEEADPKRYKDVQSFYIDYQKSINNVSKHIRKGGVVCYVVGNRTVKKVQLQTDLITVEMFQKNGFEHLTTIIRAIPNKRMPAKNSPTNEPGKLVATMTNEFIVVLKKK